jgi:hypothetical protein
MAKPPFLENPGDSHDHLPLAAGEAPKAEVYEGLLDVFDSVGRMVYHKHVLSTYSPFTAGFTGQ